MNRRRTVSRPSNVKLVLFLLLFVAILLVTNHISKHGLPTKGISFLESPTLTVSKTPQFTDAQKDSVKKALAGFWTFGGDSVSADNPVASNDRIELKSNGIIWRVKKLTALLPPGDTASLSEVQFAYLNPYGPAEEKGRILCEVRIVRQVRVSAKDTCYGPSAVDELWIVKGDGKVFDFEGRVYQPYDSKDLSGFFPPHMIDLPNDIRVKECGARLDPVVHMREAIIEGLCADTVTIRNADNIETLIDKYYVPCCLRPFVRQMANGVPVGGAEVHFDVGFKISSAGTVQEVNVPARSLFSDRKIEDGLAGEIARWRFQPLRHGSEAFSVSHTISLQLPQTSAVFRNKP